MYVHQIDLVDAVSGWRLNSNGVHKWGQARRRLVAQFVLLIWIAGFLVTTIPGVRTHPGYSTLLDGVWQTSAYFAACGICILRLNSTAPDRSVWETVAVALFVDALGEFSWAFLVGGDPNAGSEATVADAMWIAFYVLMFVALIRIVQTRSPSIAPAVLIDAILVGLSGAAVSSAFVAPYAAISDAPLLTNVVNLSYPVFDVMLLFGVLGVITIYHWRPPLGVWTLATGLLSWSVADSLYFAQVANDSYQSGGMTDGLLVLAAAVTAMSPGWHRRPAIASTPGWMPTIIPLVSSMIAVLVILLRDFFQIAKISKWLALATITVAVVRMALNLTVIRRAEQEAKLAQTDDLTGLLNRRGFLLAHDRFVEIEPRPVHAVFVLDFDRFKDINDNLGHHVGDELLRVISERVNHAMQDEDLVARFGGDEFVIAALVPGPERAQQIANRLLEHIVAPIRLDGIEVELGVSIGYAMYPEHGTVSTSLIKHADTAMFESKRTQSGPIRFSPGSRPPDSLYSGRAAISLIADYRNAIRGRTLDLHFQPIVNLSTGRIEGAEALLRWHHPTHGWLSPDQLIPLARHAGLMSALTHCVLELALAETRRWHARGFEIPVSVNVSPVLIEGDALPRAVPEILKRAGLPASALTLEITEEALIDDYAVASRNLAALRASGVRISLDDFGDGHSVLAYLRELVVDEMKIDRALTRLANHDARAQSIVRAIVAMAHSLDMVVVAEGIETPATAAALLELQADLAQGYLYSAPLPAREFEQFLFSFRPAEVQALTYAAAEVRSARRAGLEKHS